MSLRNKIIKSIIVDSRRNVHAVDVYGETTQTPYLDKVVLKGSCYQEGTPTPSNPIPIVCNNGEIKVDANGQWYVDDSLGTTREVVTDANGNTAIAEPLLGVGDYKDSQEILSGDVVRNVGIIVLKGTEAWSGVSSSANVFATPYSNIDPTVSFVCISTHYEGVIPALSSVNMPDKTIKAGYKSNSVSRLYIKDTSFSTADDLKAYLTQQYANGTPVIVVYPLATPTISSVQAQTLTTLPITQTAGAISDLPIECAMAPNSDTKVDISCNNGVIKVSQEGSIYTDTPLSITDAYGNTAYAANLFKCNSKDVQELRSGSITRHTAVKVFDGTETITSSNNVFTYTLAQNVSGLTNPTGFCNYFLQSGTDSFELNVTNGTYTISFKPQKTISNFNTYLQELFTNGNPLYVIYSINPTVEYVNKQKLVRLPITGADVVIPRPFPDYLCFTAEAANSTLHLDKVGTPPNISLQYSYDRKTWENYTWSGETDVQGEPIPLVNIGDKVFFKATSTNGAFATTVNDYHKFVMGGTISASGNIQSLVDSTLQSKTVGVRQYYNLFYDCASLITAPELPATTLATYCYANMFRECSSLVNAPALPATTLETSCYSSMFSGCSNLRNVKVYFTEWAPSGATEPTTNWLNNVAASGEFTCPTSLPDERGVSRIPSNWQREPF